MRRVIACWLVVGCKFTPNAPAPSVDAADALPFHLYVEAKIDGRSDLILQGSTAHWVHYQFAAPGREKFTNVPTTLDAVQWQPVWPDVPDAENRDCSCMSSTYDSLATAVPGAPSTVTAAHVKGRRATEPTTIQLPTADNDYTAILEFNDVGISGSDIYGANVDIVPL